MNAIMNNAFNRFHAKAAPLGAAFVLATSAVMSVTLVACNGGGKAEAQAADPAKALADKGRTLYTLRCAACHNPADPRKDGAVGPAIAGSSRELLDARVNHASYPEGYTPKRETKLMQRLPHTAEELDALAAYLNSF
jgi:mono/diheme cytochrome c family protein